MMCSYAFIGLIALSVATPFSVITFSGSGIAFYGMGRTMKMVGGSY